MAIVTSCLWALLLFLSYEVTGKELLPNLTVRSWPNSVAQSVTTVAPTSRSFFNSRLEYTNKWLPIGRGDPLKNDPTYDYSPPAVDHRIHYWDEKSAKINGNKNEILLLGVSSRRQYNNFDRRPAALADISTVMLPPPIQPAQKLNFKSEKSPNRQTPFGTHKKWPEKLTDTVSSESNVQQTIVLPNSIYDHKLNANADDVNQLSHIDYHSPVNTKSNQSRKSWLQDLLRKEVARPQISTPSHVEIETLTMHKLDDTNYYQSHLNVEAKTEMTPPYFVPTIQPMIPNDNKFLFEDMPKPISPMNLIIQGHSRVKTYGQGTEERDPKIIEVKSVENPVVNRVVSKDENGVQFDVKHLHTNNSNKTPTSASVNTTSESGNSPVAGLLSLLDLSFGDLFDNVTTPDAVNQTR